MNNNANWSKSKHMVMAVCAVCICKCFFSPLNKFMYFILSFNKAVFISIPRPDMLCKSISVNVLTCSNTSHSAVSGNQSFVHLGLFWLSQDFVSLFHFISASGYNWSDFSPSTLHIRRILQNTTKRTNHNNTIPAQNKLGSNYNVVAPVCCDFLSGLFLHSCHVGSVLPWRCAH